MENDPDFFLLPLGDAGRTSSAVSPAMRSCAHRLYTQAWNKYREAGCPFGDSEEAMLVGYCLSPGSRDALLGPGKN